MTLNPAAEEILPLHHKRRIGIPGMQEAGLILVILVLGAILSAVGHYDAGPGRPNTFLNLDNLIDGIATPMSVYAIMAVGQTVVIITGGIDISVGSIFALSALGAAAVLQQMGADAPAWKSLCVAAVVGPGIGLVCGLINGALITGLRLHPFIVTLGTLGVFRSITNSSTKIKTLPYADKDLPNAFTTDLFQRYFFANPDGSGGIQLMPMLMMLGVVLVGWFYLRMLVAGREAYAIGGNEEAARFSGLRVRWIKLKVYAISGLTAGIAGMVSLGRFGTVSTNTGSGYELNVIAAAVVGGASLTGGRGTALGALLGALVIRMIESSIYTPLHWNQEYSLGIIGAAIIVAAAIDQLSVAFRNRRLSRIGKG